MNEKELEIYYEFENKISSMYNERMAKRLDAHYTFIRQLLSISSAILGIVIGFKGELKGICFQNIILNVIVLLLILCVLSCLILLFGQKRVYTREAKGLEELLRKANEIGEITSSMIYIKPEKIFILAEIICYLSFCLSVILFVIYYFLA